MKRILTPPRVCFWDYFFFRHLPIVDELGRCVGMVTRADLTEENLHRAYLGSTDSYLADVDRVGFRRAAPEPICLKKL